MRFRNRRNRGDEMADFLTGAAGALSGRRGRRALSAILWAAFRP